MKNIKKVYILGGGTVSHISSHFAVCAPAYGKTADHLYELCQSKFDSCDVVLEKTKMAGGKLLETNDHVEDYVNSLIEDLNTQVIFFNVAMTDFENSPYTDQKYRGRIESRLYNKYSPLKLEFRPTKKVISKIRAKRKDIFLVGFKATCGASKQEMFEKGLRLCKESHVNLVLVNDVKTRWNMIITPEEAAYHETQDRGEALRNLVEIAWYRSHLSFTQSNVIEGKPVEWSSPEVPESLRQAVDHCIQGGAYKPFLGATVGHFAVKLSDTEFLTSIRKSNFNDLNKIGLVRVKTDGPDTVMAYGAKPSVGGQSQRIVFRDHPGMDCIVHFHSPLKKDHPDDIKTVSQREVECGSHQCGKNTSDNLKSFENGEIKAIMLDKHGPNIVFNSNIDPKKVINFIERNFDLSKKTGGYNL